MRHLCFLGGMLSAGLGMTERPFGLAKPVGGPRKDAGAPRQGVWLTGRGGGCESQLSQHEGGCGEVPGGLSLTGFLEVTKSSVDVFKEAENISV